MLSKLDTVFTLYLLAHISSSGYHNPEWSCIHLTYCLRMIKTDVKLHSLVEGVAMNPIDLVVITLVQHTSFAVYILRALRHNLNDLCIADKITKLYYVALCKATDR